MRIDEFASAEEQMALGKLITAQSPSAFERSPD
jgi:hypothetical protein